MHLRAWWLDPGSMLPPTPVLPVLRPVPCVPGMPPRTAGVHTAPGGTPGEEAVLPETPTPTPAWCNLHRRCTAPGCSRGRRWCSRCSARGSGACLTSTSRTWRRWAGVVGAWWCPAVHVRGGWRLEGALVLGDGWRVCGWWVPGGALQFICVMGAGWWLEAVRGCVGSDWLCPAVHLCGGCWVVVGGCVGGDWLCLAVHGGVSGRACWALRMGLCCWSTHGFATARGSG